MATKKGKKPGKKIQDLKTKSLSSKSAKNVKGGSADIFKPVGGKLEVPNISGKKLFTC
jgi:hypothetical protein